MVKATYTHLLRPKQLKLSACVLAQTKHKKLASIRTVFTDCCCWCTSSRCLRSCLYSSRPLVAVKLYLPVPLQPKEQENNKNDAVGLSELLVSALGSKEASPLHCKTSFTQADKERWQPLSSRPASASSEVTATQTVFPSLPLLPSSFQVTRNLFVLD